MTAESLIERIIGDRRKMDYDRYFVTMICLTASAFLFLLCIFHIIMGLKLAPVFIAGTSSLILFGLFLLVRFGSCLVIPKLIVSVLGLLLLDLTWYSKFMSLGPVLFFIFAFGALIVWFWEKKALILMIVFYFLNLLTLFLIEINSTNFEFQYESLRVRSSDIYISFSLYFILLVFILTRVKRDFMMQKEEAVRSDKLKTAFLANLSHEIRTPMNAIVGFSNLIERAPDRETVLKYINNIKNSSDSLLRLINEILDLSKIEAGYKDIQYSDFSIAKLFSELKDIFIIELERRDKQHIRIEYSLPDKELFINSDYIILSQTIAILLNNAIKFSSEGEIRLSYETKDADIVFSVKDNGPGIAKKKHEVIFERFTKFDYDGINTEGSGIGLSLARKMVELLGGRIWVDSEEGKGATFLFSIPLTISTKRPYEKIKEEAPNIQIQNDGEMKVLIVEDDRASYLLIREMLKPLELDIHVVSDGKDAIEFVENNPSTRLILMDLKLPFMDGYEATIKIKEINSSVKIIAQTAFAMQGDKEKAIKAGCDHYLTKPLDADQLQLLVKSYLNK